MKSSSSFNQPSRFRGSRARRKDRTPSPWRVSCSEFRFNPRSHSPDQSGSPQQTPSLFPGAQPPDPTSQQHGWMSRRFRVLCRGRLVVGEQAGQVDAERAELGPVTARSHLQHHQQARRRSYGCGRRSGSPADGSRFLAQPADDLHAAVVLIHVDECLATQVVIEMDLVPGFDEPDRGIPSTVLTQTACGILIQECLGPRGVVVQEEKTGGPRRSLFHENLGVHPPPNQGARIDRLSPFSPS